MLIIPDEIDLLSFFESEPLESVPEDGYYCYRAVDNNGVEIYFSFNRFESSIQVRLTLGSSDIAVFSQEKARSIQIEEDKHGSYLNCKFDFNEIKSKAKIYIKPNIQVKWHGLVL